MPPDVFVTQSAPSSFGSSKLPSRRKESGGRSMQAPAPVWVLFAVSAKAEGEARRVGMKEPWPKRAMAMVRRGPLLRTVVRGREVSVEVLWRRIRSLEDLV